MNRIQKEREIVKAMINLYCLKKHGCSEDLCKECFSLLQYSWRKLENCKYGNMKTSCNKCPIHCYNANMRQKIRDVMRFSGPRLLFYRPFDFFRHILGDIVNKK